MFDKQRGDWIIEKAILFTGVRETTLHNVATIKKTGAKLL